nr:MAG TPA: hypothetical protein [Caudoviricetes sp.]
MELESESIIKRGHELSYDSLGYCRRRSWMSET